MKEALLDPTDLDKLFIVDLVKGRLTWRVSKGRQKAGTLAGHAHSSGYIHIRINYEVFRAHRLIYMMYHEEWPEDQIDHWDGDRSNNAISNLRDVTNSENHKNATMRWDNTSGVTGVGRHGNGWRAHWYEQGKQKYKWFDTFEEAVKYRRKINVKYGYSKRHGNST